MNAQPSLALFDSINYYLLNDSLPSKYLDDLSFESEFKAYPYNMLLKLKKTEQSPVHHPEGTVWKHTLLVVDQASRRRSQSKNAAIFMWAALLHDIGKPSTTKVRKGKIISYNHDIVGADLAKEFLSVFTSDTQFIKNVSLLIRYHMQILFVINDLPFAAIKEMKQQSDIEEIALLGLCDRLGRIGSDQIAEEKNIQYFLDKCNNIV